MRAIPIVMLVAACAAVTFAPVAQAVAQVLSCTEPICPVGACGLFEDADMNVAWCGPCSCPSTFRICSLELPVLAEVTAVVPPFVSFTVETDNLSRGADSVLHVLSIGGAQLAMNDDVSGSLRSRVTLPASAVVRTVRILARAKSAATQGIAVLRFQGTAQTIGLGYHAVDVGLARTGEEIATARLPFGEGANHVLYQMSGENVVARSTSRGDGGAVVALQNASGTVRVLAGRSNGGGAAPARVVRNDAALSGHDLDGDGVGRELEERVGTCSSLDSDPTGPDGVTFDCGNAADPRDSDGDGLTDRDELLGAPALPLPLWGASPRHKDLFAEVDYGQSTPGETERFMPPESARLVARVWGDRVQPLTTADRILRAFSLANPDGQAGIRAHFDSGVDPECDGDKILHGDWGGHELIASISDGNGGTTHVATDVWDVHLAAARHGIFRWILGLDGSNGQGVEPGITLKLGLAASAGRIAEVTAHELGHNMKVGHSGPAKQPVDVNCKPNYLSIMSYAYQGQDDTSFSDGSNGPPLNNASLSEVGYPTSFLERLRADFDYRVDLSAGAIDWNRDGVYAPAGERVRAYANYRPRISCEYTRYNKVPEISTQTTARAPALTRLRDDTVVLLARPGNIAVVRTSSALDCESPLDNDVPCASFGTLLPISIDATGGVDAEHLGGSDESILVVASDAGGRLQAFRVTGWTSAGQVVRTPTQIVDDGVPAHGEPALARGPDGEVVLVWKDAAGSLYEKSYDPAHDSWSTVRSVSGANGLPLSPMHLAASPGIVAAPLYPDGTPGRGPFRMYGVFARRSDQRLALYQRDPVDGLWREQTGLLALAGDDTRLIGRPALAWVDDDRIRGSAGRLHCAFISPDGTPHQVFSYVHDDPQTSLPRMGLGLFAPYDNSSAKAHGMDLLHEPSWDNHLRAAMSKFGDDDGPGPVRFDPKADGLHDYTYTDFDDWRALGVGLCKYLVGHGTLPDDFVCGHL